MYEWEQQIDIQALKRNAEYRRKEIERISTTTLKANIPSESDRKYWEKRLQQLKDGLFTLEQMIAEEEKALAN